MTTIEYGDIETARALLDRYREIENPGDYLKEKASRLSGGIARFSNAKQHAGRKNAWSEVSSNYANLIMWIDDPYYRGETGPDECPA